ncbi:MAG: hypothetical protein U9Q07_03175 [Planctomycetota bacterium]|nr:hypothetical protein [Planctomycetota bacterium]
MSHTDREYDRYAPIIQKHMKAAGLSKWWPEIAFAVIGAVREILKNERGEVTNHNEYE